MSGIGALHAQHSMMGPREVTEMRKLAALVVVGLLLAPWPRGIALNHETKECGSYWRGDEYGTTELPADWQDYYPGNDGVVDTEIGSCTLHEGGVEGCCQQLGYTYVGSVGDFSWSPLMMIILAPFVIAGLVVLLVIGFVVFAVVALIWVVCLLLIGGGIFLWKRSRRKQPT